MMARMICLALAAMLCATPFVAAGSDSGTRDKSSFFADALLFGWDHLAKPALRGLAEEGGKALFREFFPSDSEGRVDTRELKRLLDEAKRLDSKNATEIRELQSALRDRMTREEVRDLLMKSLSKVNKELAAVARKVQEQQEALLLTSRRCCPVLIPTSTSSSMATRNCPMNSSGSGKRRAGGSFCGRRGFNVPKTRSRISVETCRAGSQVSRQRISVLPGFAL